LLPYGYCRCSDCGAVSVASESDVNRRKGREFAFPVNPQPYLRPVPVAKEHHKFTLRVTFPSLQALIGIPPHDDVSSSGRTPVSQSCVGCPRLCRTVWSLSAESALYDDWRCSCTNCGVAGVSSDRRGQEDEVDNSDCSGTRTAAAGYG